MAKSNLTGARLRELFEYDATTGVFTRRIWRKGQAAGAVFGYLTWDGYLRGRVDGRTYRLHHLAWLYVTGSMPEGFVDHKNRVRSDNRFDNLREVTLTVNNQNRGAPNRNSASGLLGVSKASKEGLWEARIHAHGQMVFLGLHRTPELAHAAYLAAKQRLHAYCTI